MDDGHTDESPDLVIWIDNSGLHSAGRALNRRARGSGDIDGLLQLGTLAIFADQLQLTGFEHPDVAQRSKDILGLLEFYGLTSGTVVQRSDTLEAYASACDEAAAAAANEVSWAFHPGQGEILGIRPDLPEDVREELNLIIKSSSNPGGDFDPLELLEQGKAASAVRYMLMTNDNLAAEVRNRMTRGGPWTETSLDQLSAFLRFFLNQELGGRSDAVYAPSVGRARLMRESAAYVIEKIDRELAALRTAVGGRSLPVPALARTLLARAKGEPEAFVKEVETMRGMAEPLRPLLASVIQEADPLTPEGREVLATRVREWFDVVRGELKLKKAPARRDALEVKFIFGIPAPEVSGAKMSGWIKHKAAAKRLAALTDISREVAYSTREGLAYQTCVELATGGGVNAGTSHQE